MATLVSLEEAKRQLRVEDTDQDEVISEMAEAASAIILDYIKQPDAAYDDETVPPVIKTAVKMMVATLFCDREATDIPDPVKSLLTRYRDPALA